MSGTLIAAVVLVATSIASPLASPATDVSSARFVAIDRDFICPEALPNGPARTAALESFVHAFTEVAPDETIQDMMRYRTTLLDKHGCIKTLNNVANAKSAVQSGEDVEAQAWLPLNTSDGIQLYVSTDHLKPTLDPRFPGERSLETYTKLVFRAPRLTSATHVRYDQVISHNVYYCKGGRYALIENDYFLFGKEVLNDRSAWITVNGVKTYDTVATPDGSFNAVAERWDCAAVQGDAT